MSSIEKAIIVGLVNQKQDSLQTQEFLDELAFLALTSGAKVLNRFTQRLNQPLTNTFIGKGKLGEIKDFVKEHHIDLVIFDDDLTATQLRNIERILSCKILDRSNLILDIFASRARTSCKNSGRVSTIPIFASKINKNVDALGASKGGIGMRGLVKLKLKQIKNH